MPTAISINSRYRRAARHVTWWILNVCKDRMEIDREGNGSENPYTGPESGL